MVTAELKDVIKAIVLFNSGKSKEFPQIDNEVLSLVEKHTSILKIETYREILNQITSADPAAISFIQKLCTKPNEELIAACMDKVKELGIPFNDIAWSEGATIDSLKIVFKQYGVVGLNPDDYKRMLEYCRMEDDFRYCWNILVDYSHHQLLKRFVKADGAHNESIVLAELIFKHRDSFSEKELIPLFQIKGRADLLYPIIEALCLKVGVEEFFELAHKNKLHKRLEEIFPIESFLSFQGKGRPYTFKQLAKDAFPLFQSLWMYNSTGDDPCKLVCTMMKYYEFKDFDAYLEEMNEHRRTMDLGPMGSWNNYLAELALEKGSYKKLVALKWGRQFRGVSNEVLEKILQHSEFQVADIGSFIDINTYIDDGAELVDVIDAQLGFQGLYDTLEHIQSTAYYTAVTKRIVEKYHNVEPTLLVEVLRRFERDVHPMTQHMYGQEGYDLLYDACGLLIYKTHFTVLAPFLEKMPNEYLRDFFQAHGWKDEYLNDCSVAMSLRMAEILAK